MGKFSELWERIGALEEDEPIHVLTRLYTDYDELLDGDSQDEEAVRFFQRLENAINYCVECNLNRR